jgi:hypothetical protein
LLRAHKKFHFFVPRFSVLSFRPLSTPCATMGLRFCCAAASRVSTAVTAAESVSDVVSSFALAVATPAVMHAQLALSRVRRPRSADAQQITRGSARHWQLEPPPSLPTRAGWLRISTAWFFFGNAVTNVHVAPRVPIMGAFSPTPPYR